MHMMLETHIKYSRNPVEKIIEIVRLFLCYKDVKTCTIKPSFQNWDYVLQLMAQLHLAFSPLVPF